MSDPKRHHFVPQFYLRRFSEDDRSLRLIYKKGLKFVPNASIRGQCVVDNFHAWHEGVEAALGYIEGGCSVIIRSICDNSSLPADEWSWLQMLLFISMQSGRTKLVADAHDAMTDVFAKIMFERKAEEEGIDLSNLKIANKFPVALPLGTALETFSTLRSLDACLLKVSGGYELICSDNPVILYNSLRSENDYRGVIGLDSGGLQIIFPLSPSFALYLYDGAIYRAPSNTGLRVISRVDALKINLLHYLWSGEAIYFRNADLHEHFLEMAEALKAYTAYDRVVFSRAARVDANTDERSELIHNFRAHAPIELQFEFAKVRKGIKEDTAAQWRSRAPKAPRIDESASSVRYEILEAYRRPRRQHLKGSDLSRIVRGLLSPNGPALRHAA